MASTSERVESLKGFEQIHVKQMTFAKKTHNIVFNPALGLFRVLPVEGNLGLASFAISAHNLFNGCKLSPLSKRDKGERMAWRAKLAWKSLPAKRRNEIIDKMPLNSLFLSGDTI